MTGFSALFGSDWRDATLILTNQHVSTVCQQYLYYTLVCNLDSIKFNPYCLVYTYRNVCDCSWNLENYKLLTNFGCLVEGAQVQH